MKINFKTKRFTIRESESKFVGGCKFGDELNQFLCEELGKVKNLNNDAERYNLIEIKSDPLNGYHLTIENSVLEVKIYCSAIIDKAEIIDGIILSDDLSWLVESEVRYKYKYKEFKTYLKIFNLRQIKRDFDSQLSIDIERIVDANGFKRTRMLHTN